MTQPDEGVVSVAAPASSANLGAGFDVFGMAVSLFAEVGIGDPPLGAQAIDAHHPAHVAHERAGGDATAPLWLRSDIPMARGLGFSGAVRVAGAGLAVAERSGDLDDSRARVLAIAAELEGHGDNVVASVYGGVAAYVGGRAVPFRVGPTLGAAAIVAWVPDVTTSTDKSRKTLAPEVRRDAAVHNIGVATQLALAFAHDDPELLCGAADDRLHQAERLPLVPGAADAIDAGVAAGAWCAWLSGSGPTVAMLAPRADSERVAAVLPTGAHTKILELDRRGLRSA